MNLDDVSWPAEEDRCWGGESFFLGKYSMFIKCIKQRKMLCTDKMKETI